MAKMYSSRFYNEMKDTSLSSAQVVVPMVMDYVHPNSIIDIGCGTGVWLKVFHDNGVKNIHGYDGAWVKDDMLVIPKESFSIQNLEELQINSEKADLCVCLEVAEHLPGEKAKQLVNKLTSVAPVVLFSAAIPYQDGDCHINEQWPEYWEKIFNENGFVAVDSLRWKIWNNPMVSFFYSQNILIYVDQKKLSDYPKLNDDIKQGLGRAAAMVHPYMYKYYAERWKMIVPILGKIPPRFLHFAKRFLGPQK